LPSISGSNSQKKSGLLDPEDGDIILQNVTDFFTINMKSHPLKTCAFKNTKLRTSDLLKLNPYIYFPQNKKEDIAKLNMVLKALW